MMSDVPIHECFIGFCKVPNCPGNPREFDRIYHGKAEIARLEADNERLQKFIRNVGTSCTPCEKCGHAKTDERCLHCELAEAEERIAALKTALAEANKNSDTSSPKRSIGQSMI